MTYEEFKVAWVEKEIQEILDRRGTKLATQGLINSINSLFDWIFPIEMKEVYEISLSNGTLQQRCGI